MTLPHILIYPFTVSVLQVNEIVIGKIWRIFQKTFRLGTFMILYNIPLINDFIIIKYICIINLSTNIF